MILEELLNKYDLFHSSIINGGKVKFNINYILNNKVYISLVSLINKEETKESFDFTDDEEFKTFVLPKILQRFLSKNAGLNLRRIMGNESFGTLIIERRDLKDSLVIRNCSKEIMDMANKLLNSMNKLSDIKITKNKIIFEGNDNPEYDNYMKYNTIFDYATYKNNFQKNNDLENKELNNDLEKEKLLILNIARYATTFENVEVDVWQEIIDNYKENENVKRICEEFKNNTDGDSQYSKALILAEYEKNNDLFLHNNENLIVEALDACNKSVNFFNNSYLVYWKDKEKYYNSILDAVKESICKEFVESYDLNESKKITEIKNRIDYGDKSIEKESIISKFKKIKKKKLEFTDILNQDDNNNNNDSDNKIELKIDEEKIKKDALDQAKRLIELEEERNQLKKDADDFAKTIIKNEKEYKMILASAEEQARKIIELQQENEELKKMAEENAKFLAERDRKIVEEEALREYVNNMPVKSQDIDKINNLLNAISTVKELDFAVNHPTIMQELIMLEQKIITYLMTHKNIVHEEDDVVPMEKEEILETKPVIELLAMIRNTYISSHYYEKDGRHSFINFSPVDEDTYRVTLYSVKGDSEDMLMDTFFEEYQLTDNVIKELCDIFKTDSVIVASKTDNIPPDKADYLVIDNMDNAIKFMDCKKEFIERVKTYL